MTQWFEDDKFWEEFSPFFFTSDRMQNTAAQVDGLVDLLKIAPGGRVLDLCCGVGRHSLELSRRGFAVTGVDRTHAFLERARKAAGDERLAIEWVEQDMREFRRPQAFGAAINCVTSFGYFEDQAQDRLVARNLFDSLNVGARLVIEMMGKEVLARIFQERSWERLENGVLLLREHKLRSGWDWIETHLIVIGPSQRKELTFSARPYSGQEIRDLLVQTGFREVNLYGNLKGSAYDNRAERLVVVARK